MASRRSPSLAILLPPSEGKASGGHAPAWRTGSGAFGRTLGSRRAEIARALGAAKGGSAALLGVGGSHLARARESNRTLVGAKTLPACERYTGVVWEHLSPGTLGSSARRRASESIVVLSGLLGAVGFDDPVPDYRLKMGASLPPLGKLSTWWRPSLSAALDEWASHRFVVDLLPGEHRAAWIPNADEFAGLVSVAFVEKSGKVAGHDAKAAKGLLVRHLLESRGDPERALKSWKHPRFRLSLS